MNGFDAYFLQLCFQSPASIAESVFVKHYCDVRSLDASSSLINHCAEQLCSHLGKYAADGSETDIWRDYGIQANIIACKHILLNWEAKVS